MKTPLADELAEVSQEEFVAKKAPKKLDHNKRIEDRLPCCGFVMWTNPSLNIRSFFFNQNKTSCPSCGVKIGTSLKENKEQNRAVQV